MYTFRKFFCVVPSIELELEEKRFKVDWIKLADP